MQKAKQASFETFDASKWRIGIVVAQFNRDITTKLEASAIKRAHQYNIPDKQIDIINVAGAVEIPLALQTLAKKEKYNVLLAIGCVIQGETPHFDYVCKFVTEGVLRVQLDQNIPIGFGVLTCHNMQEAISRSGLGGEHLDAVLQQAKVLN